MFFNKISKKMFWEFKNIKRYSVRPAKFFSENDTEHSFMATVIAIRLAKKYKLSEKEELQLIKLTLFHDIGELVTGDINAMCKTEALSRELEKIEEPIHTLFEGYFNYSRKNKKLEALSKAADLLCVKFFGDMNEDKELSEAGFTGFKKYLRKFKELK